MTVLEQRPVKFDSAIAQAFTAVRQVSEAPDLHAEGVAHVE